MTVDATLASAFIVALLGGVHCVGMCGGIVSALTLGLPSSVRGTWRDLLPYLLAYNSARILSYTIAGGLVGGIGAIAANLGSALQAQTLLQCLAGLFMIALGLYLAGWWHGLASVEHLGAHLVWRHLEPLRRRVLPVRSLSQAWMLGMLWGWLPCGLVYSVLIWAVATGSAFRGAALMFFFGLGTLPALLAMGGVAGALSAFVRTRWVRILAGASVLLFGLGTLVSAILHLLPGA